MSKTPTDEEAKSPKPQNPDAMNHDIKLQETSATNLRANAVPVDGFILSVDGKLKTRYESERMPPQQARSSSIATR